MLSIHDLRKIYADRLILAVANLQFAPGTYWLRGENGSGKSTFFRCIAGLIPFDGDISFRGTSIKKDRRRYLQHVTYCEAEPFFPGFLSAYDLINFVGDARGASKDDRTEMMSAFGIDQYAFDPVQTYSSGMVKKTALALSFLGNPDVIVLDEPFVTLDADSQRALVAIIRSWSSKDRVFLLSSHQDFAPLGLVPTMTFEVRNQGIIPDKTVEEK